MFPHKPFNSVCCIMCSFGQLPFRAYFFGTINKIQKSGCLLFHSFMNLHLSLSLSLCQNISHPSVTLSSLCPFLSVSVLSFAHVPCSLLTGSSEFPLVTAHPVIIRCDSTLSSPPCFKEPLPLGGRVNGNLNRCFSTAGPLLHVTPNSTSGEGSERERGGGGLSNTHNT